MIHIGQEEARLAGLAIVEEEVGLTTLNLSMASAVKTTVSCPLSLVASAMAFEIAYEEEEEEEEDVTDSLQLSLSKPPLAPLPVPPWCCQWVIQPNLTTSPPPAFYSMRKI